MKRKTNARKNFSSSRKQKLVIGSVSLVLIGYGLGGLLDWYRTLNDPDPQPPLASEVVNVDTNDPDETPVDLDAPYDVPAHHPRKITIPSIGAEGFIQQVGTTAENQIAVPSSIHFAGWYTDRAIPGEAGVSLIDGHVSGKYSPGIFKELNQLSVGEEFIIEFGDLSTKSFEVLDVKTYDVDEVDEYLLKPQDGIKSQLNLITCGGNFDAEKQQYEARVLVASKLIK